MVHKKCRIWETLSLPACADSSTKIKRQQKAAITLIKISIIEIFFPLEKGYIKKTNVKANAK